MGLGVAADLLFLEEDEWWYCLGALVYGEECCLLVSMLVNAWCNSTAYLRGRPPE